MKDWIRDLDSRDFHGGAHSQSYQDALLDIIFSNVGTTNVPPFCVEFGFNAPSLVGGSGANVTNFILRDKWQALLLDGEYENPAINLRRHFLTSSNICEIFRTYGVPKQPEYVSIDVDSTDLWLFEALVREYRAMVYSVEYNGNYPLDAAITFPNDPKERWEEDRGYGASLKALTMVAEAHGYSLLWVVPGADAFFIRNDLIEDGSGRTTFPLSKWRHCTEMGIHRPLRRKQRLGIFIDYEVYLRTSGDLAKSRESALPVCKRYLLDSLGTVIRKKLTRTLRKLHPWRA